MSDKVEMINNSIIQHGKFNDRIYLMKTNTKDLPEIIYYLDELAGEKKYSKIFVKVPREYNTKFFQYGYKEEAYIPKFYSGYKDVSFLGKFFSENRKIDRSENIDQEVIKTALTKSNESNIGLLGSEYDYRICNEKDIEAIARVYSIVFETYPFPIQDPKYIKDTMEDNVVYFGVFKNNDLVSVSSTEIDFASQNAEMTDFATIPNFRSKGLSGFLLTKMESEMKDRNILTLYTICRSCSYGINIIFSKAGYKFTGKLVNNTNIAGNLENMNIWYKHI